MYWFKLFKQIFWIIRFKNSNNVYSFFLTSLFSLIDFICLVEVGWNSELFSLHITYAAPSSKASNLQVNDSVHSLNKCISWAKFDNLTAITERLPETMCHFCWPYGQNNPLLLSSLYTWNYITLLLVVRGSIPMALVLILTIIFVSKAVESLPEQYHTNCVLIASLDKIISFILSWPYRRKIMRTETYFSSSNVYFLLFHHIYYNSLYFQSRFHLTYIEP